MRNPGLMLAVGLAIASPGLSHAADLRGRIIRKDPYRGIVGAEGVQVTLLKGGKDRVTTVLSGTGGSFYLYRVQPGTYALELTYWNYRNKKNQPLRVPLRVDNLKQQPITDIVLPE